MCRGSSGACSLYALRDIVSLFSVAELAGAGSCVERIRLAICDLGGDGKAYRRERASAVGATVADVHCAPRVTAAAKRLPKYGMMPGLALDIPVADDNAQPFDFSLTSQRDKAEASLDAQQQVLLIGSPMCTASVSARSGIRFGQPHQEADRIHLERRSYT